MTRAKSDSDETSLAPSSSPTMYYLVQTPSRDSGDGDKSTPPYSSPVYSPSHPSTLASSASRVSRCSRFGRKRHDRAWPEPEFLPIEEDEEDYGGDGELTRPCRCLAWLLGLLMLNIVVCLIIWGASRHYRPLIAVKSLTVSNFHVGEGTDQTGVPTKLLTVNCSVKMIVFNPATFFGIHVSSSPVHLFYSEIAVATGQLNKYYQPKNCRRLASVNVEGRQVPLYGAGAASDGSVPWRLEFDVRSRGNVVGKLVRTKHRQHVRCSLAITSSSSSSSGSGHPKAIKFHEDSCTYI
ncbi:uncharacterized protein LOC127795176 [Diospyros lotus]|uniref:uncharacterized protein LOC127795176 n=1 Tax=Diospyros lotus TaxID=55363 RepID=UPI00225BC360|nr:uncharacterized protein LOC127795176 [Diospyros lotus]